MSQVKSRREPDETDNEHGVSSSPNDRIPHPAFANESPTSPLDNPNKPNKK